MPTHTAYIELGTGVVLLCMAAAYVWKYGLPLGSEEGGFSMWPQCAYGTAAWSGVGCYGKQAVVIAMGLAGLGLIVAGGVNKSNDDTKTQ